MNFCWLTLQVQLILIYFSFGNANNQWKYQKNYEDKVGDSVSMTGQGMVYLATSDSFNEIVNIYVSYYQNQSISFGQMAQLKYDHSTGGFGKVVDFLDDDNSFEKTLFIGQNDDDGSGHTYIYTGFSNQWTMAQILYPPSKFRQSRYSSYLRSDFNTTTLAVGCPYCNVTIYGGQIYLYQRQNTGLLWTNTQVLMAEYVDYLTNPQSAAFFMGGLLSLDRAVLLSSILTYRTGNDFIWGFIIFSRSITTGVWSQQQTITSAIYDSTSLTVIVKSIDVFAVYDETIVFSTVSQPYQGIEDVGAVTILYPNTKRYTPTYTPTPTILTSPSSSLLHASSSASSSTLTEGATSHLRTNKMNILTDDYLHQKFSHSTFSSSPKPSKNYPRQKIQVDNGHNKNREEYENIRLEIQEKYGFQINPKVSTSRFKENDLKQDQQHQQQQRQQQQQQDHDISEVNSNYEDTSSHFNSHIYSTSTTSSTKLTSRGLSWSTRQILYPPGQLTARSNFGSDLSIYRNTLIIGEQGTSRIYYYARDPSSIMGYWSHQQTLTPSRDGILYYSDNYLSNSYLMSLGLISLSYSSQLSSISMDFQINNEDWSCLLLSLEDVFGDGWGNDIYLSLTTPMNHKYYYTMVMTSFDSPNPFVIRYCPDEREYEYFNSLSSTSQPLTTYTIQIERNQSTVNIGPFFWEIQYRTQIERLESSTIYGNYGTKVRYFFNWNTKSFEFIKSSRNLTSPFSSSSSLSCESCRVYSQSDIYYSASIDDMANWRYLNMFTNTPSIPWYNQHDPYHSTYYYLSDMYGSKLIYSGTMCLHDINDPDNGIIHSCWLDIPSDGTYLLRISGALYFNPNKTTTSDQSLSSSQSQSQSLSLTTHSWNFCSQSGYVNSHIYFTVSNNGLKCIVNAIYPLDIYKQSNLQSFIYIDGIFKIIRTELSTSSTLLTASDRSLFSQSITSVLWNISPRDVSVNQEVIISSLNYHENYIQFILILNIQTITTTSESLEEEYNEMKTKDYYYMRSLGEEIISDIEEGVENGNILQVLKNKNIVPNSKFFWTITSLSISNKLTMREEITIIPSTPPVNEIIF